VPDTQAHTHDGQRQQPRDRPDIGAHLTLLSLTLIRRSNAKPMILPIS
jgi:hypothetical protein